MLNGESECCDSLHKHYVMNHSLHCKFSSNNNICFTILLVVGGSRRIIEAITAYREII